MSSWNRTEIAAKALSNTLYLLGSEVPLGSKVKVGSSVGVLDGKPLILGAGVGETSTVGLLVGKVVWGAWGATMDMEDKLMESSEANALQKVVSSTRTSCNSAETRRRRR